MLISCEFVCEGPFCENFGDRSSEIWIKISVETHERGVLTTTASAPPPRTADCVAHALYVEGSADPTHHKQRSSSRYHRFAFGSGLTASTVAAATCNTTAQEQARPHPMWAALCHGPRVTAVARYAARACGRRRARTHARQTKRYTAWPGGWQGRRHGPWDRHCLLCSSLVEFDPLCFSVPFVRRWASMHGQ